MPVEVLVEYTVPKGQEADADAVRAAFLRGVAEWEPDKVSYRIFRRAGDQQSYVHIASVDSEETQQRLFETDFFKEFDTGIKRASGGTVTATRLFEWSPS